MFEIFSSVFTTFDTRAAAHMQRLIKILSLHTVSADSVLYQPRLLTADSGHGYWLWPVRATVSPSGLAWASARYRASGEGVGTRG